MGGSDSINGLGGDDCIVTSADAASEVNAGDGNDDLRAPGMASLINGGADTDTCEGGSISNCEVVITPTPTP